MDKHFAIPGDQMKDLVRPMGYCLISDRVTVNGLKIGYMYREEPDAPDDSGWRFFSGDETEYFSNEPENFAMYAVNTAANYDPDIISFLNTPPPCAFEKIPGSGKYRQVEGPG